MKRFRMRPDVLNIVVHQAHSKETSFYIFIEKDDEAVYANFAGIKINARKLLRWGKTNSVQQKRQNVDKYILIINHEYVILLIV